MKTIPLTRGMFAVVDDDDLDFLSQWGWYAHSRRGLFYAARKDKDENGKTVIVSMHTVIDKTPPGFETDHRNGDTLDNQKSNLRTATHAENGKNRKLNVNSTSGIKGVSWDKKTRKWRAYIKVDYKMIHLGFFISIEDAANARRIAAQQEFGAFNREIAA